MTSTKVADYMSQFERNDNSEKSKKVGKFETLRKLLSFSRPELPKIILGFSALVVNAATNLSFPWILGEAVDQTRFSNHNEHIYFIFGAAGLFVIASAASFIRVYCLGTATESISTRLRKILFRSYIDKDMDFFDENKKGQLITILNKDVTVASELITEKLAAGIRSINSSLNGSILLFASSPYLFSISIGMLPIIGIGAMSLSKTSKVLTQKLRNMESNILSFALERFSSITTIRLYGREHFENNSFSHQLDDYTNTSIHNSYVKSSLMSFINLSTNLSLCIVLYVGGILIKQGKMTPGELTKFALQSAFVGLGFSGLSVLHGDLVTGLSAAERVFDVIEASKSDVKTESALKAVSTEDIISLVENSSIDIPAIEFINVSFRYKSRSVPIFNGLSLSIKSKMITAIAGRSGSGKSTAMALISGLYQPSSGKLLFKGKDISATDIRKYIGVVEQSVGLLSGTITSNIAYGKDGATMDEIITAAQRADADEFIQKLPDGYNTQIGETGSLLSGGQKARIALARALVRDPECLLLDEATSALDRTSELEIVSTLKKLAVEKTIVVFTHSEMVMKHANIIHVLKDGVISISGDYESIKSSAAFD